MWIPEVQVYIFPTRWRKCSFLTSAFYSGHWKSPTVFNFRKYDDNNMIIITQTVVVVVVVSDYKNAIKHKVM